jgi:acyl-CoA dehydrogenase
MQLEVNPELAEFRQAVRQFVMRTAAPFADVIDQEGGFPPALLRELAAGGYLGMRMPTSYGGADLTLAHYCLVQEELSRAHPILTIILAATNGLAPMAILRHGTAAQRERYLPLLTGGGLRTAFALTEPEAGSDAAAIKTVAVRAESGWVINGRKHFISGGEAADVVLVMAVTDTAKRARGGITGFLVDRGTPGFAVSRVDHTMGSPAWTLAELTFENCIVPEDAVLGNVGGGFRMAMESLDEGRMSVACTCIGAADRLLELGVAHAKTRRSFGAPLAERQAIQWMLADSATDIASAQALAYEVLRQIEAGIPVRTGASMCKLVATEMAGRVADRVVQIHGGSGVVRGLPIERFYRDLRIFRVGEGASEIQRMVIARGLLRD